MQIPTLPEDPVFERKIESTIRRHFESADQRILLIEGACQIGKTYTIRRMGKACFKHFVEINMVQDIEGEKLFADIHSTKDLYYTVQSIAEEPLGDYGDTLVFLDEIQEYPHLFTLMKFLGEEKRYRFIASGSLLGVEFRRTASIPVGSVSVRRMYPMDLEEFLWANGVSKELIAEVRSQIDSGGPVTDGVHKRFMDLFRDYLISGGLPGCLSLFLRDRDLVSLRDAQSDIFRMYANDASKYDLEHRSHTRAILDMIPSSIENKRKRIFVKDIEGKEKARFSDYKDDFDDLVDSGVVLLTACCSKPAFPLRESAKRNLLKLYLADVGLLTGILYRYNAKPLREDLPQISLGSVYECFTAMQLASSGCDLYYSDSKAAGEVDFLIDDYDSLSIVAIEVKSGKDSRRRNALDRLMGSPTPPSKGIVLSNSGDVVIDGDVRHLPIYAAMFLGQGRNRGRVFIGMRLSTRRYRCLHWESRGPPTPWA